MTRRVGRGTFVYEEVKGWGEFPAGYHFGDVADVAVDSQDRVYVLTRSDHPVMVLDHGGSFLTSWGEGQFARPHGAHVGPDDSVYCVDDMGHAVCKFTVDGELVMRIAVEHPALTGYILNRSETVLVSGPPFNRPTGVAVTPSGEMYIADGYGNARVHKFSADGKLLFSWGEPGGAPGQFRLPHNIYLDRKERVWIPDRENSRIQIFDSEGKFLTEWTDVIRPTHVFIDEEDTVYVSELCLRVSIFTIDGKLITRWGNEGKEKDTALFHAPHVIAVDSQGDLYVGEVSMTSAGVDKGSRTIQKFARKK